MKQPRVVLQGPGGAMGIPQDWEKFIGGCGVCGAEEVTTWCDECHMNICSDCTHVPVEPFSYCDNCIECVEGP